ncbi:MAG: indole-3-glycerol phosphate synthase TrpC [Xenococcaceae cyanobacterium]
MNNQLITKKPRKRHILEEIFWHKLEEVKFLNDRLSLSDLKTRVSAAPATKDFLAALRQNPNKPALIAEVKKASPSKGIIRADFDPVKIATAYERSGASCLSVLTDEKFFQGSFENLWKVRKSVSLPLLCKEFIIDPYQIYLARFNGADAVLLIAALLSDRTLVEYIDIAKHLGMNALIEVHTQDELARVLVLPNVQLVGINNRNLKDFSVDLATTTNLLAEYREAIASMGLTIVSESGLYTAADIATVAQAGANAVLIGESLVKQTDIQNAVKSLRINVNG